MGLKHGQFCWHELMTTDADAAKAFYSETIGWKVKSMDGMPDYNVLFVGEDSVGGIMTMPDEVKAPPLLLVLLAQGRDTAGHLPDAEHLDGAPLLGEVAQARHDDLVAGGGA